MTKAHKTVFQCSQAITEMCYTNEQGQTFKIMASDGCIKGDLSEIGYKDCASSNQECTEAAVDMCKPLEHGGTLGPVTAPNGCVETQLKNHKYLPCSTLGDKNTQIGLVCNQAITEMCYTTEQGQTFKVTANNSCIKEDLSKVGYKDCASSGQELKNNLNG